MKNILDQLSLREKRMMFAGIIVTSLLLLYLFLWAPLNNNVMALHKKIQANQLLLDHLKTLDQKIRLLQKQTPSTLTSFTSFIQTELKQAAFAQSAPQIKQLEKDSVQVSLETVSFDTLIQWLFKLTKTKWLDILEISIQPTSMPGQVKAIFTLKGG